MRVLRAAEGGRRDPQSVLRAVAIGTRMSAFMQLACDGCVMVRVQSVLTSESAKEILVE